MDTSQLTLAFRLRRAIRVIQTSPESIERALSSFDDVVRQAEEDVVTESAGRDILQTWLRTVRTGRHVRHVDFRYFCPRPAGEPEDHEIKAPDCALSIGP